MTNLFVRDAIVPVVENQSVESRQTVKRELSNLSRKLLTQEIGFVYNREFENLSYEGVEKDVDSAENYIQPDIEAKSLSALLPYLASLYSIPMLTAFGEAALFRKMNFLKYWANGFRSTLDPSRPSTEVMEQIQVLVSEAERTRNQIIESNLRLVVSIARKFAVSRISFDELVSEGNMILLKAVEKFDYSRGFRFSTYVTHAVQRHYFRHFRRTQRRNSKEHSASQGFLNDALSDTYDEHDGSSETQANTLLSCMKDCLDEREQFIIRERFGFGEKDAVRTFQSISKDLGISKERVRQLLQGAVDKLRQLAVELKLDGFPI